MKLRISQEELRQRKLFVATPMYGKAGDKENRHVRIDGLAGNGAWCWSGPFRGWRQFRKEFPNENVEG